MVWDKTTARAIEVIYDSLDAEQGWEPLLSSLSETFDASGAHIFLRDLERGEFLENCMHGWGPDFERGYERLAHLDPRAELGAEHPGEIINDVEYFDDAFFESTTIYNELLERAGVRHSLTSTLPLDDGMIAGFALLRSKSIGGFSAEHAERLQILLPHMIRALRLQKRMRQLEDHASDAVAALDRLPGPGMIVSETLEIVCLNRQAEALVDDTDELRVRGGELGSKRPQETSALQKAVADTVAIADSGLEAPISAPHVVSVARAERLALEIFAVPLRPHNRLRQRAGRTARVLLMIHDPEKRPRINPVILERLFGFTATEAIVAARLAEGKTAADIAVERRCSEATVRTHIKRILRKTETNRQVDLVRLILLAPVLASGSIQSRPPAGN